MTPEEQKLVDELLAKGFTEDEIVAAFSEDEGGTPGVPTPTPTFEEKVAERQANKSFLEGFGDVATDLSDRAVSGLTFGLSKYAKAGGEKVGDLLHLLTGEPTPEEEEALRIEEAAKYKAPELVGFGAEILGSIPTAVGLERTIATKALPALVTKFPQLAKALTPFMRGEKVIETLPAQALSGGGAGAIQGGISSLGEEDQAGDVLAGAAFGAGMPLAVKAGGGLFNFGKGMYRRAKPGFEKFIAEPVTQKYLGLAEKLGLLNNKASKIIELDDTTRQALEFLNRTVPNEDTAKELIKKTLGVMEEKGPLNIKLNEGFDRGYKTLQKLGVFDKGGTINSLTKDVGELIETGKGARDAAIDAINTAFIKINKGAKSPKDLVGIITPKDITPFTKELKQKIAVLNLNARTKGLADAMEAELKNLMNDIKPRFKMINGKRVFVMQTPTTVLKMTENLNKVRRLLFQEFNAGNVKKEVTGDALGAIEGSIAVLDDMQDIFMDTIAKKLKTSGLEEASGISSEIFKNLNEEYSALRTMDDILQMRGRGASSKGTITFAPPGQEPPGSIGMSLGASGPRFYGGELMDRFLGSKEGMPKMLAALLASEGIENSPEAIKLLAALQKGGRMMIPPEGVGSYDFSKLAPPLTSGIISMMNRGE